MDLRINDLRILFENDHEGEYIKAASQRLQIAPEAIRLVKILNKALDIFDKQQFYYEISIVVTIPDSYENTQDFPVYINKTDSGKKPSNTGRQAIIIGFGPAGMFAALTLLDYGIKPIIFERGKKIEERSHDVQKFIKEKVLCPESNIQFGEGGAGSYSDGKLFSRKNNSPYLTRVLDTFIKFGAPEEIGYAAKPHLGTDVLCGIVRNIRNYILGRGGEINYRAKMTDLLISNGKISGVVINGEKEFQATSVFLAVGHSARDTFAMLHKKGVVMEQKPISVGVRMEHPAAAINLLRYGRKYQGFPGLGAANYSFIYSKKNTGRGVNTFCMCPGGEVVNASSENGLLVLNGMSYRARASAFSNAAIVVTCETADYKSAHPLAGIDFQKEIERKAFNASGGKWEAPAQNLLDFLSGKISTSLNKNSYKMGSVAVNMLEIFPDFVGQTLVTAFNKWREDNPLYFSPEAIILGPETRTSSPVRIKRGENYASVNVKNLYPIGEGAGYTGGITSSALDAIKAVERMILIKLKN